MKVCNPEKRFDNHLMHIKRDDDGTLYTICDVCGRRDEIHAPKIVGRNLQDTEYHLDDDWAE